MSKKSIHTAFLTIVFSIILIAPRAIAETTLIYAGELLAVAGEPVKSNQTIVVSGQRIIDVRDGFLDIDIANGEFDGEINVVDLRNQFVLPGLMDMHVHLMLEFGPDHEIDGFKMSSQLQQMKGAHYGMKTLMAGFTTVRDAGALPQEIYALRDAIHRGWIDGPRIIAAGIVGITGGHADVSGARPALLKVMTHGDVCDGPYDCRRAARNSIKYGADFIKIAATGGVVTDRATGVDQQMESDELKEIVLAAKRMGRKVAAHAHAEEGIIAALEAGVASIEHGTFTGRKAIKLFIKTGAYLVPTLLASETSKQMSLSSDILSEPMKEKAIRVGNVRKSNFAQAQKAGVKIAFGTDSGLSKHGANAREAVLMFEAGMSPVDIIKSATVNSADLLGMSDVIGTIEKGKYADIISVENSPLEDIEELLDVSFVMKEGKVYKNQNLTR